MTDFFIGFGLGVSFCIIPIIYYNARLKYNYETIERWEEYANKLEAIYKKDIGHFNELWETYLKLRAKYTAIEKALTKPTMQ